MIAKTLSLLILTENALYGEALMAQFQSHDGFDAKIFPLTELQTLGPDVFSGLDLVLLVAADPVAHEKLLRSNFYHGPVLSLVSGGNEIAQQDLLRLPVRYPALLQKIRSLAGSYWFRDDLMVEIGPFTLRPAFKELAYGADAPIALTDKEVEILIYLYRAGGKIVSREVLLAEIWGYNAEVSTHTLETHVYRLRQKIETVPDVSGLLMTETGGYRLASGLGE